MKRVGQLVWSFVERLVGRASSALLAFILAISSDPTTVGLYSWVAMALTLYQGVVEVALRQAATPLAFTNGAQEMRRRVFLFSASGSLVVAVAAVGVSLLEVDPTGGYVWFLLAMAPTPLVTAVGILPTAKLQRAGKWQQLANIRLFSSSIGLLIALGFACLIGPFAAVSVFPVSAEMICTGLVVWRTARLDRAHFASLGDTDVPNELRDLMVYGALGWFEGQSDRMVMGGLAGTDVLGSYSTAVALGRSGGDAVSSSSANVLRANLSDPAILTDELAQRNEIEKTALPGLLLIAIGTMVVWVASYLVLPRFMHESWSQALNIAPILAVGAVPSFITWNFTSVLALRGGVHRMLGARMVGVGISVLVGLAATRSLFVATWIVVLRECIIATSALWICREVVSRKTLLGLGAVLASLVIAVSCLSLFLS